MLAALDAGAEDIVAEGDDLAGHLRAQRPAGGASGRSRRPASPIESADTDDGVRAPTVALDSAEAAKAVLRLIDALDDHDDVQDVYANFDIPDESSSCRSTASGDRARPVGAEVAPDFDRPTAPTGPSSAGAAVGYTLYGVPGQPRRAGLLPGRRHAGLHGQLNAYTDGHRPAFDGSTPRCWPSARSRSRATSASPRNGGFAFPLLADADKTVGRALRHPRPARLLPPVVFVVDADGHRPLRPPGRPPASRSAPSTSSSGSFARSTPDDGRHGPCAA